DHSHRRRRQGSLDCDPVIASGDRRHQPAPVPGLCRAFIASVFPAPAARRGSASETRAMRATRLLPFPALAAALALAGCADQPGGSTPTTAVAVPAAAAPVIPGPKRTI